jgi:parallel beta-helix repeat protein
MGCPCRGLSAIGASLLLVALTAPGSAETTRRVPEEFPTISAALQAAEPGDAVVVAPGVYRESLVFTEEKGDRVILRSSAGPDSTTIAYGDSANANEAVITMQRCSDFTRLMGFTIDGRDVARRGVLVNSESQPALSELVVVGCEFAVAAHKGASPSLENVSAIESRVAGLFVSGASARAASCRFAGGAKLGVYVDAATAPVRLQDVELSDNGQTGLQATDGEISFEGGIVARNGDSGIVLARAAATIRGVAVDAHANVGVVMESSPAVLDSCTISNNGYGAVASGNAAPTIRRCTFDANTTCHVAVEAEASPRIGGSAEDANRFLGATRPRLRTTSSGVVVATHNFWDDPCAPPGLFEAKGAGSVSTWPWMSADGLRAFEDCAAATEYHEQWRLRQAPPATGARGSRKA